MQVSSQLKQKIQMMMEEINKRIGWFTTREHSIYSRLTGATIAKLVIGRKWISNFAHFHFFNREYVQLALNRSNGLRYYLYYGHRYALSFPLPEFAIVQSAFACTRHVGLHVFHQNWQKTQFVFKRYLNQYYMYIYIYMRFIQLQEGWKFTPDVWGDSIC